MVSPDRLTRFAEAYLMMAQQAHYRPQAPGDGMGHILLSQIELDDDERLSREAVDYAMRFAEEDDDLQFAIGCSNFTTNRAFVFAIEAARLLCSGIDSEPFAARLLKMATAELRRARREIAA